MNKGTVKTCILICIFCVIITGESDFYNLLDIWFPDKKPLPTAFLVDTSEEALLLPDWLKLRMIRSEVSRLVDAGKNSHSIGKMCFTDQVRDVRNLPFNC